MDAYEEDDGWFDLLTPEEQFAFVHCRCRHCKSEYALHVDFDMFACLCCGGYIEPDRDLIVEEGEIN
jgi:hypothetical protein